MVIRTAARRVTPAAPMLVGAGLALALGLWGLDRPALFGSEADSYYAARLPLGQLFHLLSHVDAVHGVYYVFLHVWMLASSSLAWLRMPSVLGTMVAAALVGRLGQRVAGPTTGLLAGVLFALSPFVTEYEQDGRSYAIVTALVCVAASTFVTAARDPRPATWLRYGAALAVAGWVHEFALLAGVAFGATILLARLPRTVVKGWFAATFGACVVVAPLIALSIHESAAIGYLPRPNANAVRRLVLAYFGPSLPVAIVTIVLAVIALVARRRDVGEVNAATLGAPVVVVAPFLLIVASLFGPHSYYDARYVLWGTVGVALLVGHGLDVTGRLAAHRLGAGQGGVRLVTIAVVIAVLAVLTWPAQERSRTLASKIQNFTGPSVYLRAHARTGDAIFFSQPRFRAGQLAYPADYSKLDDVALATTPEASGTYTGIAHSDAQTRTALAQHQRVWMVGECRLKRPTSSHAVNASTLTLLEVHYRPKVRKEFLGLCVWLFVRP